MNYDKEYVLMDINDYNKLLLKAKIADESDTTIITSDDLSFLNTVMQHINPNGKYKGTLTVYGTTVKIVIDKDDDEQIENIFDLSLCKKYYNHVSKFIGEVV